MRHATGNNQNFDLEKFSKDLDVLDENSQESSKYNIGKGVKTHLSLIDYINEMEKKSFYFR